MKQLNLHPPHPPAPRAWLPGFADAGPPNADVVSGTLPVACPVPYRFRLTGLMGQIPTFSGPMLVLDQ